MANPIIPELREFLRKHEGEIASGEFELKASFRYLEGREAVRAAESSSEVLDGTPQTEGASPPLKPPALPPIDTAEP